MELSSIIEKMFKSFHKAPEKTLPGCDELTRGRAICIAIDSIIDVEDYDTICDAVIHTGYDCKYTIQEIADFIKVIEQFLRTDDLHNWCMNKNTAQMEDALRNFAKCLEGMPYTRPEPEKEVQLFAEIELKEMVNKFNRWANQFNEVAGREGIEPNVYHHHSGNAQAYQNAAAELSRLIESKQ